MYNSEFNKDKLTRVLDTQQGGYVRITSLIIIIIRVGLKPVTFGFNVPRLQQLSYLSPT